MSNRYEQSRVIVFEPERGTTTTMTIKHQTVRLTTGCADGLLDKHAIRRLHRKMTGHVIRELGVPASSVDVDMETGRVYVDGVGIFLHRSYELNER